MNYIKAREQYHKREITKIQYIKILREILRNNKQTK